MLATDSDGEAPSGPDSLTTLCGGSKEPLPNGCASLVVHLPNVDRQAEVFAPGLVRTESLEETDLYLASAAQRHVQPLLHEMEAKVEQRIAGALEELRGFTLMCSNRCLDQLREDRERYDRTFEQIRTQVEGGDVGVAQQTKATLATFEEITQSTANAASQLEAELNHVRCCCNLARDTVHREVSSFRSELDKLQHDHKADMEALSSLFEQADPKALQARVASSESALSELRQTMISTFEVEQQSSKASEKCLGELVKRFDDMSGRQALMEGLVRDGREDSPVFASMRQELEYVQGELAMVRDARSKQAQGEEQALSIATDSARMFDRLMGELQEECETRRSEIGELRVLLRELADSIEKVAGVISTASGSGLVLSPLSTGVLDHEPFALCGGSASPPTLTHGTLSQTVDAMVRGGCGGEVDKAAAKDSARAHLLWDHSDMLARPFDEASGCETAPSFSGSTSLQCFIGQCPAGPVRGVSLPSGCFSNGTPSVSAAAISLTKGDTGSENMCSCVALPSVPSQGAQVHREVTWGALTPHGRPELSPGVPGPLRRPVALSPTQSRTQSPPRQAVVVTQVSERRLGLSREGVRSHRSFSPACVGRAHDPAHLPCRQRTGGH